MSGCLLNERHWRLAPSSIGAVRACSTAVNRKPLGTEADDRFSAELRESGDCITSIGHDLPVVGCTPGSNNEIALCNHVLNSLQIRRTGWSIKVLQFTRLVMAKVATVDQHVAAASELAVQFAQECCQEVCHSVVFVFSGGIWVDADDKCDGTFAPRSFEPMAILRARRRALRRE